MSADLNAYLWFDTDKLVVAENPQADIFRITVKGTYMPPSLGY